MNPAASNSGREATSPAASHLTEDPSLDSAQALNATEVPTERQSFDSLQAVGYILLLIIKVFVPIIMIAMGSIYFNECPAQPNIPIYLIVAGVLAIIREFLSVYVRKYGNHQDSDGIRERIKNHPFVYIYSLLMFIWFLVGSYWVFSIYNDSGLHYFCHPRFYSFAFWITISLYVALGIAIIFLYFDISPTYRRSIISSNP